MTIHTTKNGIEYVALKHFRSAPVGWIPIGVQRTNSNFVRPPSTRWFAVQSKELAKRFFSDKFKNKAELRLVFPVMSH